MDCFKKKLSKTKIIPKTDETLKCLICYTTKRIQEFRCDNCFTDTGTKAWYICRDCNIDLTEKGMNCPVCRGVEKIDNVIINHYSKSEKCMFSLCKKLNEFKKKFNNGENINNNDEKNTCYFDIYICTGILKILFIIFTFTLIFHTICMKNMSLNHVCYICYINSLIFVIYCFCNLYLFFKTSNECIVFMISIIGTFSIVTSFATVGTHNSCSIDYSVYILMLFLLPAIYKLNIGLNII
jgi:hypothetical protein